MMQMNKIMDYYFKRCHMASLELQSGEEIMSLLNKENKTKQDYIDLIIRAQYMLDTAENMYDMNDARCALNQIKDAFYWDYPEYYNEWWRNAK